MLSPIWNNYWPWTNEKQNLTWCRTESKVKNTKIGNKAEIESQKIKVLMPLGARTRGGVKCCSQMTQRSNCLSQVSLLLRTSKMLKCNCLKLKAWLQNKQNKHVSTIYISHSSLRKPVRWKTGSKNRDIVKGFLGENKRNRNKTVQCPISLKSKTLKPLAYLSYLTETCKLTFNFTVSGL